ncbi:MAG TPA: tripartite tricarboxylate transporter substrate-binding protein [Burkholderiales bacterium]|jgi:tripartite-type tricarboxylate transporter receptor subunit TctC|nr:tripartite tricarboxylate transporter substrate-binding protein [Burkholderiales bacterium]
MPRTRHPVVAAHFLTCALGCVLAAGHATAQTAPWPNKPIRAIVQFPAGGAADTVLRTIAQPLGQALGQSIVVDNRPGADGAIAADAALKSAPDGYTLFLATNSALNAVPALRKAPPYNPLTDFTPIGRVGYFSFFLFVNPQVPAKNVGELIAYIRANPGKVNYAGATSTGIMAAAQLASSAKLDMVRVPYKGEAPATIDLVSGQVQLMFATATNAMPAARDGRLKVLATLLGQRSPVAPDAPTMTEAGAPRLSIVPWAGFFGPAKLPADIVARVNRELNAVIKRPEVREQTEHQSFELSASTPEELAAFNRDQLEAWKTGVRDSGLPQD